MTEIINLRMARKARKRADQARRAETNRASFGRTREERAAQARERQRLETALDGARREED